MLELPIAFSIRRIIERKLNVKLQLAATVTITNYHHVRHSNDLMPHNHNKIYFEAVTVHEHNHTKKYVIAVFDTSYIAQCMKSVV